jgi:hypothetical protein
MNPVHFASPLLHSVFEKENSLIKDQGESHAVPEMLGLFDGRLTGISRSMTQRFRSGLLRLLKESLRHPGITTLREGNPDEMGRQENQPGRG